MIDVFGSKNLLKAITNFSEEYPIKNIILSSSLESQFSKSITPSLSKMEYLNDDEKQVIFSDFRKNFRKLEDPGKILVVDFLGERNTISNYNNSKITLNNESKKYLNNKSIINMPLDSRIKLIPTLINQFVNHVSTYEKVVICEFYLSNYYIDHNNLVQLHTNQYSINKVNALLKTFYDYLKYQSSSYTFLEFNNIYSEIKDNVKPNPWVYSEFSLKNIEKKLYENLTDIM